MLSEKGNEPPQPLGLCDRLFLVVKYGHMCDLAITFVEQGD